MSLTNVSCAPPARRLAPVAVLSHADEMRRSSDPPRRPARRATGSATVASGDELTRDNPKGRLWELCAVRRVPPPEIRHSAVGPRHRVEMRLLLDEWELETGVHWGSSRRMAEQLAARALLVELLERDEPSARPTPDLGEFGDDVFDVDEADATRLRQSNPKGQVYEWCQQQKPAVRRPRFEERQVKGGGFVVRGHLDTLDLHSPWFRARRRKEAERAAAEALLGLLPVADDALDADPVATANPRTVLNELVVHGLIEDCAVEVTGGSGEEGPGRFIAEGRATLLDGSVVRGEPAGGANKRAAITGASGSLLAQLEALGVGVTE